MYASPVMLIYHQLNSQEWDIIDTDQTTILVSTDLRLRKHVASEMLQKTNSIGQTIWSLLESRPIFQSYISSFLLVTYYLRYIFHTVT